MDIIFCLAESRLVQTFLVITLLDNVFYLKYVHDSVPKQINWVFLVHGFVAFVLFCCGNRKRDLRNQMDLTWGDGVGVIFPAQVPPSGKGSQGRPLTQE